MEIETGMGEALGRFLDLANSEIKLTAVNMANIDTPGYKAVGLDFAVRNKAVQAYQQVMGMQF
jgi:flagellar basal-body rod protein FlgB